MNLEAVFAVCSLLVIAAVVVPGLRGVWNWKQLAKSYPAAQPADQSLPALRVVTGPGFYAKAWCRVEAIQDGLLLEPAARFRLLQRPILIPWDDIKAHPGRAMFASAAVLHFAKHTKVAVRVPGKIVPELLNRVGAQAAPTRETTKRERPD